MNAGIFDSLPIWSVYIGITLSLLLSFEVGYQVGKYIRVSRDAEGLML